MSDDIIPKRPLTPSEIAAQPYKGPPRGVGIAAGNSTVYEVVSRTTHVALPDSLIADLWLERAIDHPTFYRIDVADPATHVTLADGMMFVLRRTIPGESIPEVREFVAKVTHLKNYASVGARGAERQFKMEWTIRCLSRTGPVTTLVQVINAQANHALRDLREDDGDGARALPPPIDC